MLTCTLRIYTTEKNDKNIWRPELPHPFLILLQGAPRYGKKSKLFNILMPLRNCGDFFDRTFFQVKIVNFSIFFQ